MNLELRKNKDFWAGMMLFAIGSAAMLIARDYRFGSTLRMGPGFFPVILGGLLAVFGICIMAVGMRSGEKIKGSLSLRALVLVPLSLILFGILMKLAGFIPALMVLVLVSTNAHREYRFVQILLLAGVLTVLATAVFIWGLGLPFPLIKGF